LVLAGKAVGLALGIVVAEALRRRTSVVAFGLARGFVAGAVAYWGTLLLRQMVPTLASGWANRHIPSEVRATVLSLVSQAAAVGQIAGGPIFGWVAIAHSIGAAPVAAGLTLLPALPLLRRARASAAPGRAV